MRADLTMSPLELEAVDQDSTKESLTAWTMKQATIPGPPLRVQEGSSCETIGSR
jgi:hypothetical protein